MNIQTYICMYINKRQHALMLTQAYLVMLYKTEANNKIIDTLYYCGIFQTDKFCSWFVLDFVRCKATVNGWHQKCYSLHFIDSHLH